MPSVVHFIRLFCLYFLILIVLGPKKLMESIDAYQKMVKNFHSELKREATTLDESEEFTNHTNKSQKFMKRIYHPHNLR